MLSLRRQLRLLQAYVLVSWLVLVLVATGAFRQSPRPQNLGEITVERINVVDANGTLRLVIANKDRMHPGVVDGRVLNRPRPYAGMLFFNDQGDEVGGLLATGEQKDGQRHADAGITFDQLKQDQVIGVGYQESNGARIAALRVWDRPDTSLGELVDKVNAAQAIVDPERRRAALRDAQASQPGGKRRLFVGRNEDQSVAVTLADAQGRTRVNLKVDATGTAGLEFLDENGKVIERLPRTK